jgi:hypothetical protein
VRKRAAEPRPLRIGLIIVDRMRIAGHCRELRKHIRSQRFHLTAETKSRHEIIGKQLRRPIHESLTTIRR